LHLVPPRMSRLGEAVTQDDAGTTGVAGFGDNKIDAVSADGPLLNTVAHGPIVRNAPAYPMMSRMTWHEPTSSPQKILTLWYGPAVVSGLV